MVRALAANLALKLQSGTPPARPQRWIPERFILDARPERKRRQPREAGGARMARAGSGAGRLARDETHHPFGDDGALVIPRQAIDPLR